ncbi:MAG: dihydrolipoamide acetyltransferase family protein [Chloroflexota bacterium]
MELILPKFNMDMESGVLVKWLRAEGDHVREGDPVAEIETDKVNMEVEATADGVLTGLRFAEGDTVPVTAPIATIAAEGGAAAGPGASRTAESRAPDSPGATLVAPATGADGGPAGGTRADARTSVQAIAPAVGSALGAGASGKVRATPAVRRLARERGIDLATLAAAGERVTAAMLEAPAASAATGSRVPVLEAPARPGTAGGPSRSVTSPALGRPLDPTRRAIAERMTKANEAPQITLTVEVRAGALSRLRASSSARPSFSALFAVAVARALRDHPALNVTFEDGHIVDHDGVQLGIAVARPAGLIVPVLHDADRLAVLDADREIRELVARARDGGLRLDDVTGGTFTITSLGEAGVDVFSPLLNPPQVGILGIGRLANRVIAIDDGIRVEPTVHLSLSCDHRVIDGEPGAAFLATLRGLIERPEWLAGSLAAPSEEG